MLQANCVIRHFAKYLKIPGILQILIHLGISQNAWKKYLKFDHIYYTACLMDFRQIVKYNIVGHRQFFCLFFSKSAYNSLIIGPIRFAM